MIYWPISRRRLFTSDMNQTVRTDASHVVCESVRGLTSPSLEHEPEYFKAVASLSDKELTNFTADDLKEVRVATSAYGLHLFGKVELAEQRGSYFMFRAFISGEGSKLHSLRMDETEKSDGDKVFNAIFSKDDKLEWFDT
ncbi:hypothetical protein PVAG01_07156 [Phlyctema vagabunda]|uniref:Cystatin domain-containing protein n=1 Tax=Phlyctema vagabunda TaxID=108571 RepID=A0ABR4PCE3_9HELO